MLFANVPLIEPDPLVFIPLNPAGVVLVQVNVIPATLFGLVISIVVIGLPEQTD